MTQNSDKKDLNRGSPLELALQAVANTDAVQAKIIEKAISEGRLTLQDVRGYLKTQAALQ